MSSLERDFSSRNSLKPQIYMVLSLVVTKHLMFIKQTEQINGGFCLRCKVQIT